MHEIIKAAQLQPGAASLPAHMAAPFCLPYLHELAAAQRHLEHTNYRIAVIGSTCELPALSSRKCRLPACQAALQPQDIHKTVLVRSGSVT